MALSPTERAIRDREKASRAAHAKRGKGEQVTTADEDADLESAETGEPAPKAKKS